MGAERGTVERVVRLLQHVVAGNDSIGVRKLAEQLQLPESTTHRLINQLVELGMLQRIRGTRQYEFGTEMYRLGTKIAARMDLARLATPALQRVVEQTREGCALGIYREADATLFFAAQIESPQPLRYYVDLFNPVPVLWGASGRAVLAFLPPKTLAELLSGRPRSPTGMPPLKLRELQKELALVRQRGYSVSQRGERVAGASGISVPIHSSDDRVVGCLSLTIPTQRYRPRDEPKLARLLRAESNQLSDMLGDQ